MKSLRLVSNCKCLQAVSYTHLDVYKRQIYGYAGRLFYIDTGGEERVMPVHGYEAIILSTKDISEPEYAVRYFYTLDINGCKVWTVEFYDDTYVTAYTGHLSKIQ